MRACACVCVCVRVCACVCERGMDVRKENKNKLCAFSREKGLCMVQTVHTQLGACWAVMTAAPTGSKIPW